jgi:(p)ppGpp synthase/HD superfamily hydrolase
MVQFRDEVECMVAVLHDVVEDTTISLTHLLDAGYPAGVVAALDALTRREDEAYEAYIERVAHNHVATRIKLVDLAENLANNKWHPDDHATRSESVGTKRPLGTWAGNGRH